MLRLPNQQVGDAWFFVDGDTCHAYFLTCPMHVERHTLWDIGHATSRDLHHWDHLGLCFQHAPEPAWDDTLATGSVIQWGGRFVMAYTGHRTARVGLAVSDDLQQWTRLGDRPVTAPEPPHYATLSHGFRTHTHWRDPALFTHDGLLYHAVCASQTEPTHASGRHVGAVGLARTQDLTTWELQPPPEVEPVAEELECPQILQRGDLWYLVYSTFPQVRLPEFRQRHDGDCPAGTFSMVAPHPMGPYRLEYPRPIAENPGPGYAAQVVRFRDADYLIGTADIDHGGALSDPVPITAGPQGFRATPA